MRSASIRVPDVFASGSRLVVAFSGGQDSTCLLHALANAHKGFDLLAAHIDHGLRLDSAESALRVQALAQHIGVASRVERVEVARRGSVQQAARAARYEALARIAEQHQAKAVLVAHTADDQAETVLLNLLRGTGLLGLAGMRLDAPSETPRLVRPLLGVTRPTTLAYCKDFGLSIVEDASNQTRVYTRNRVRLDLLPLLRQFNPAIHEVLARTAELAGDDLEVLDRLTRDVEATLRDDRGAYDLRAFRAQPRALQRRLLRDAYAGLGLSLQDVADKPLEDALDLLQTGQPNQTYHLPYGVEVCIKHQSFELQREGRALGRQARNTWESVGPRV
jgi:tRNA(Ile)-lysidine synthase